MSTICKEEKACLGILLIIWHSSISSFFYYELLAAGIRKALIRRHACPNCGKYSSMHPRDMIPSHVVREKVAAYQKSVGFGVRSIEAMVRRDPSLPAKPAPPPPPPPTKARQKPPPIVLKMHSRYGREHFFNWITCFMAERQSKEAKTKNLSNVMMDPKTCLSISNITATVLSVLSCWCDLCILKLVSALSRKDKRE